MIPTIIPFGEKLTQAERRYKRKKKMGKNTVNIGHLVP
jgi:hypothetical protein